MARMGRPTDDPKTERLLMRLTVGEEERLRNCAEALNTTKTEIILWGLRLAEAKIEQQKRQGVPLKVTLA